MQLIFLTRHLHKSVTSSCYMRLCNSRPSSKYTANVGLVLGFLIFWDPIFMAFFEWGTSTSKPLIGLFLCLLHYISLAYPFHFRLWFVDFRLVNDAITYTRRFVFFYPEWGHFFAIGKFRWLTDQYLWTGRLAKGRVLLLTKAKNARGWVNIGRTFLILMDFVHDFFLKT